MKKLITTLTFLMVALLAFSQSEYRKMYGKYEYNNNVKFLDSLFLPNLPGVGNNVILDTNTGMLVIDSSSTAKTFESGQNLDLITSATLVKYLLNDTIDSLSGVITDSLRVNNDAVYFDSLSGTGDNIKIDTATGKVYRGLSGSPLSFQAGSNLSVTNISDVITYELDENIQISSAIINDFMETGNLISTGRVSFSGISTQETSQVLYIDNTGDVTVGAAPNASNHFYRTFTNNGSVVVDNSDFNSDIITLFARNAGGDPIEFNESWTYTADATINILVTDSVEDIPAHGCVVNAYISVFSETESERAVPVNPYSNLTLSQTTQSIRPEYDLVDGSDLIVNSPEQFHETISLRSAKFRIPDNPYIGVIVNVNGCGGADFDFDTVLRIRRTSSYNMNNENAFDSP